MMSYEEAVGVFSEFWQGILIILVGAILGLLLAAIGLVGQL